MRKACVETVRNLLTDRSFNEKQIQKIIPHLHEEYFKKPEYLTEILDTWNNVMSKTQGPGFLELCQGDGTTPAIAKPGDNFMASSQVKIDMNYILGDVEPKLLLMSPQKVVERHRKIGNMRIALTSNEHWLILVHAPKGFYLQSWPDLVEKAFYIQDNVLELLYDQKTLKEMQQHPLLKCASVIETELDHIRTRYLFAKRSGYVELAHMFKVQMALQAPDLRDLLLSEDMSYLQKFAPFCSIEAYRAFGDLIKNHEIDEDDVTVVKKLAELNSL